MQVQKIYQLPNYHQYKANINKTEDITQQREFIYASNPASYGITFEARVDKGLERFAKQNADKMPKTMKKFIDALADKSTLTPLQAQAAAFAGLVGLTSVAAIKGAYPDEELFADLKEIDESKATRGILGRYRENKELLNIVGLSILANQEDFTVWLVKKIFLEAKTLKEINDDFQQAIDPEFKSLYEDKELSEEPIRSSTLYALGIHMPEVEYMQSLRYTREGYSDMVGEKISDFWTKYWDSLPPEQRGERAKRSVSSFETWWNGLSDDRKLELIDDQDAILDMLEMYKKSGITPERTQKSGTKQHKKTHHKHHSDTPSSKSQLATDELFRIWAANNLKIYMEGLTDLQKKNLEIKRIQRRSEIWQEMSPEEKTEYINRLRSGAEPLKYAIIEAWNENPDILIELSKTLTKEHIEKPAEAILGTDKFNEFMSNSMAWFWRSHPDYAERFGMSIRNAHSRIKDAIQNNRFEQIKIEIMRNRMNRIQQTTEEVKNYKEILNDSSYDSFPEYMRDFIDAYSSCPEVPLKFLPIQYLKDFFKITFATHDEDVIRSWSKCLRMEELDAQDEANLEKITEIENITIVHLNRSLEATLAEIIYGCTKRSEVYLISSSQLQQALKQIADGKEYITIGEIGTENTYTMKALNHDIDINKINYLYNKFRKPLSDYDIQCIISRFFEITPDTSYAANKLLLEIYLRMCGSSCKIVFSDESPYPAEVRNAYIENFKRLLKKLPNAEDIKLLHCELEDIVKEDRIMEIDRIFRNKFSFLSEDMLEIYIYEMNNLFRNLPIAVLKDLRDLLSVKPKTVLDKVVTLPSERSLFRPTHNLKVLCIEQALADILYEATGEAKFYAMKFEELVEYVNTFNSAKKFPLEIKGIKSSNLDEPFDIKLKHRLYIKKLEQYHENYHKELLDYLNEIKTQNTILEQEQLLYLLNPDENKKEVDKYTNIRIASVFKYIV